MWQEAENYLKDDLTLITLCETRLHSPCTEVSATVTTVLSHLVRSGDSQLEQWRLQLHVWPT